MAVPTTADQLPIATRRCSASLPEGRAARRSCRSAGEGLSHRCARLEALVAGGGRHGRSRAARVGIVTVPNREIIAEEALEIERSGRARLQRMDAARVILEDGRHPMGVVARDTDFADRDRMRRAFLHSFGQPPASLKRASG